MTTDASYGEVPEDARGSGEDADGYQHDGKRQPTQLVVGGSPLDVTLVHIEDPRQRHYDRESRRQADDDVAQNAVGPVQTVHHWLDDLKHCERGDTVANERPEHAPALQLGDERRG